MKIHNMTLSGVSAESKSAINQALRRRRKGSREFVKIEDNVGLEFEVNNGSIWMRNGTYSPGISIDIDEKQTLSGFTRKISLQGCVCEVVENAGGYAELLIRSADSE